jgi:hypothetical protein
MFHMPKPSDSTKPNAREDCGAPDSPRASRRADGLRRDLSQAYLSTHYIVDATPPFCLLIGEPCIALLALYQTRGIDCGAYLTACNPHSRLLDTQANAERQACLIRDLRKQGIEYLEGRGRHPDGGWPAEPSVLALGIDRRNACALGRKYEQNALVLCGADAVPRLIWL